MSDEIMVSVICTAYNHEKYIRKCLDGFVMQKTNFKFEVLVHDDASTDCTADIIREYEAKYPEIIKPIYQSENKYSQGINIWRDIMFPVAKGKYLAFCEGDDYWIDENKIQKQFDFMETHPNCTTCYGANKTYNNITNQFEEVNRPKEQGGFLSTKECFWPTYFPQTSTCFTRIELMEARPDFTYETPVGDVIMLDWSCINGDVYCFEDVFSCYNANVEGSWTMRSKKDYDMGIRHRVLMKAYYEKLNEYTNNKYREYIDVKIDGYNLLEIKTNKSLRRLRKNKAYLASNSRRKLVLLIETILSPNIILWYRKIRYGD